MRKLFAAVGLFAVVGSTQAQFCPGVSPWGVRRRARERFALPGHHLDVPAQRPLGAQNSAGQRASV